MIKTTLAHTLTVAILVVAILSAASIFGAAEANAQPTIELKFHKDFGYSSFGNDAQGNWTAQTTTSSGVTRVEFYLNESLQYTDNDSPFAWSYTTDNYPLGLHTIKAIAYDAQRNTATAEAQQNFVSFPGDFVFGTIAIAVVAIIIAIVIVVIKIKKTNWKPQKSIQF